MRNALWKLSRKKGGGVLSQYLAAVCAAISIFTAGINYGWPLPSLKRLMSEEYPIDVSEDDASYITIANNVGNLIGGVSATFFLDRIGRRNSSLLFGSMLVASLVLINLSWSHIAMLYAARVIGGIGEGGPFIVAVSYTTEMASPHIRGILCSILTIAYITGSLWINVLGSFFDIHTTALICLVFPVLFLTTFPQFPDSPYYYLLKKDEASAMEALRFFRMRDDVELEMEDIKEAVARQMSERGRLIDLFIIKSNRKALIITTFARIFQISCGANTFGQFYQYMIEKSTDMSPLVASTILILIQIVAVLISTSFVDTLGRKPIILISYSITCITLFILAIYLSIRDYTSIDTSVVHWLPFPLLAMYTATFWGGLGNVLGFLINEMFSTSIKSKALACASITYAVSIMAVTKFFHYTLNEYGMAVPLFVFAFCSFIGIFYYKYVLIETKGKTLEEIQQKLKGHDKKDIVMENGKKNSLRI